MKTFYYQLAVFATISLFSCTQEPGDSGEKKQETSTETKEAVNPPQPVIQAERYAAGDELNVLSLSGLNLRQTPDEKGTKIITIPYGSKVKVLSEKLRENPFQTEECKGYSFTGHWVKISYNGKEGFIFDGYLSKMSAPPLNQGDYIAGYLGKMLKLNTEKTTKPKELENVFEYHLYEYSGGTTYELVAAEGGASHTVSFPENTITMEEAFMLGTAFESKNLGKKPCNFDAAKNTLTKSGDMSELTISKQNGKIILKIGIAD
ncbi:MAG: SH3 domain-containing protein [Bacteroidia bacterium]|nr:SH3 domain-containing protein [Bacteroidia bacterium]